MGNGARGIGVDQLGRLVNGDAVAATDEGIPLDHGASGRCIAPGSEGDDLAFAGGALAASRLGRDARGLAEQAEERRLVLAHST